MREFARISLARLPTPVQKLNSLSRQLDKEIFVWRDDLTGMIDSGNKLRKLEFLMADAMAQGCDWVVTCGGPQSNHTRATSAVARQLGLGVSVLILPKADFDHSAPANANLLLNQIFDARITWINNPEFHRLGRGYTPFFEREVEQLKKEGKKPYVIPLGGSNPLGCQGYRTAVSEMLPEWRKLNLGSLAPDHIFCALGTGGTFLGIKMGIEHESLGTKLHGINVIGPMSTTEKYVTDLIQSAKEAKMPVNLAQSEMIDGYVGLGYAQATDKDLTFYRTLARTEGLILDPCYTGKAFQGMISEIKKRPSQFGEKILFLHSGGAFGNFAYAEQYQRVFAQKML